MCYALLRKLLFCLPPELAHAVALRGLALVPQFLFKQKLPAAPTQVMGIDFPNPVGLAAGLDKNAEYIRPLAHLGFGFIEVGTVTPQPQPGNPKPRLFRLVEHQALINRLGFNNHGLSYLIQQIQRAQFPGILGINIGKNATTPLEAAVNDYLLGMQGVYPYAHYIVINLSSPNTAGLRTLQHGTERDALLIRLKEEQHRLAQQHRKYVPLVVKISPDLAPSELVELANALLKHEIDGVIATNTTLSRPGLENLALGREVGGLSGQPLQALSTATIQALHTALKGKIPIIAAGGIITATDAAEKFAAGASLVQIYTGLIYRGPRLLKEIVQLTQPT